MEPHLAALQRSTQSARKAAPSRGDNLPCPAAKRRDGKRRPGKQNQGTPPSDREALTQPLTASDKRLMSMWHVALLEHLERHEEMLRRVSLEHVERQEEMLRRVLTEIAAGQQELATEQRAEDVKAQKTATTIYTSICLGTACVLSQAYPEKPDLLLTAFWPAVLELVKTATLPQPGVSKRDAEE